MSFASILPICLLLSVPNLPAEDTPATLSARARLVNLPVRDKKGKLVETLTRNDFVLTVDNNPGTIHCFDATTTCR